jgi:hypothetical protein
LTRGAFYRERMLMSRKLLCAAYASIALVALIATWSQNILFFKGGGSLMGFWEATKANPASRSITVDIALLLLSVAILMVIEARRLGVKFVWAYIIGGFLIAISVTFPLFLLARELRLCEVGCDRAEKCRLDPACRARRLHAGVHHLGRRFLTANRCQRRSLHARSSRRSRRRRSGCPCR